MVCFVACAVSWATWFLFTSVPAPSCAFLVPCPRPRGSCSGVCPLRVLLCVCGVLGHLARSPVCPLGVLCCVCGVLGHLAPVHQGARWVCCVACAVSWATWLLFTSVPVPSCALLVPCPRPRGSCSGVCPLHVLLCVCGVLGHVAPVHRCAGSVCCVACTVSWAPWLLFTGVSARCVVLRVWCPGPLGSCSPACPLGVLCRVCTVLCHLAPVHRCARSVCCVACTVSWAIWHLFTSLPTPCVVLSVRCPGPLGSCSPGVPARCFVLRARCPGPLGSCSPACLLGVLCCMCGVQGPWPLFTGVPARCVVLRVRCPGPLGPCSPLCPLGVLCCVCGVLGHLAPFHRCARSVLCFACAVYWATRLLFRCVPAPCVALRVRCPGPLGSRSPVR